MCAGVGKDLYAGKYVQQWYCTHPTTGNEVSHWDFEEATTKS